MTWKHVTIFHTRNTGLTDGEIVQLLNGVLNERTPRRRAASASKPVTAQLPQDEPTPFVPRQPLNVSEDDICPICQDTLQVQQALTWCRMGCGNNIHAKCMILYAQHSSSKKSVEILCPLCRCSWGASAMQQIREDGKTTSEIKNSAATVSCIRCTVPLRQVFFRCVECSQKRNYHHDGGDERGSYADYCQRCYELADKEKEHVILLMLISH